MREDYQKATANWAIQCFGADVAADRIERNYRFIEEALELVQSTGCTKEDVLKLVDYVFDRKVGETFQEVGGVVVTLSVLCYANNIEMDAAAETELERILLSVDKIRAKHFSKPAGIVSPLPGSDGSVV